MTDWIRCNKCFLQIRSDLKFYIKECGRIECQKCLKPVGNEQSNCINCKKSCKTVLLASDMKPEIQLYFKPIQQLLDSVKKIYEFQMRNHINFTKHLYQKYTQAKNEMIKCHKAIDAYKKDNARLKMMLKSNQSSSTPGRFSSFSTSTPMQQGTSPSLLNLSLSTVTNAIQTPKNIVRPGFPRRMFSDENQSFSPQTPTEHVVPSTRQLMPPGSRQLMVPTHRNTPSMHQKSMSALMTQMSSHFKGRPHY